MDDRSDQGGTGIAFRGRAKELLPPDDRFQGFRHENESFIILFYMV